MNFSLMISWLPLRRSGEKNDVEVKFKRRCRVIIFEFVSSGIS
jgi:hypothetical protein